MGLLRFRQRRGVGKHTQKHEAAGKTFAYNSTVRTELPTSLSLSAEETARRISNATTG